MEQRSSVFEVCIPLFGSAKAIYPLKGFISEPRNKMLLTHKMSNTVWKLIQKNLFLRWAGFPAFLCSASVQDLVTGYLWGGGAGRGGSSSSVCSAGVASGMWGTKDPRRLHWLSSKQRPAAASE